MMFRFVSATDVRRNLGPGLLHHSGLQLLRLWDQQCKDSSLELCVCVFKSTYHLVTTYKEQIHFWILFLFRKEQCIKTSDVKKITSEVFFTKN